MTDLEAQAQRVKSLLAGAQQQRYLSIGGVVFAVNPNRVDVQSKPLQQILYTAGGVLRQTWGAAETVWTIEGSTLTYGMPELRRMDAFRPLAGKRDALYALKYPFRDLRIHYVYIQSMDDFIDSSRPLMPQYRIEAVELPGADVDYYQVAGPQLPPPPAPVPPVPRPGGGGTKTGSAVPQ